MCYMLRLKKSSLKLYNIIDEKYYAKRFFQKIDASTQTVKSLLPMLSKINDVDV